ncbi:MAG: hypothetical protein AAF664_02930 [Planctomycetota bacterium]
MSTDATTNISQRNAEREKFGVSKFDIVSSFLMATMLFIGVFVTMLFIIWLTSRLSWPPVAIEPIIENPAGRGDNAEGFERDFEPPGAEEVEELLEPTLAETLEAVTDAVSSVAASLSASDSSATASTQGTGKGDSRPPGPEGEGDDIVPRFERWELNYTAKDLGSYAKQLDYYKIELGAVGPPIQGIDYVTNLAGATKTRRIKDTSTEKRLYFSFKTYSPLKGYEEQLHTKVGVDTNPKRMLVKFLPKNLENALAQKELAYAKKNGHQSITEVAKTIFESKSNGNGYEFQVISQRYRKPRW